MNQYLSAKNSEFVAAVDFFKKDISTLRTGRANPAMLEGVSVEAYGAHTPINGVANISVADAKSLTVTPWDKNIMKDLEKALVEANLGMGIVNEGEKVRLTIPPMNEENRKDLVKKTNEKMEKAKISLRQLRDEVKGAIEDAAADKAFSEDDKFRFMKELDEATTKFSDQLKELRDKKEADIMEV